MRRLPIWLYGIWLFLLCPMILAQTDTPAENGSNNALGSFGPYLESAFRWIKENQNATIVILLVLLAMFAWSFIKQKLFMGIISFILVVLLAGAMTKFQGGNILTSVILPIILVFVSIPIGKLLAWWRSKVMLQEVGNDMYRGKSAADRIEGMFWFILIIWTFLIIGSGTLFFFNK